MAIERNRLSASRVPIDDHPELIIDEEDPLLSRVVWVIMAGALVYIAMLLASPEGYLGRIYGVSGLVALTLVAQLLLHFRGVVPTVRLLAIGGWLLVTFIAFVGEGVRGPIMLVYPIILIFSGWMLGAPYAIGLLIASTISVILMVVGQEMGFVGGIRAATPGMLAVAHVIVLAMSAALTIYLLRVFRRRYAAEYRLNDEIKLNLKAVEKRESYLRSLLENFPFMVWLKDERGRYRAAFRQHRRAIMVWLKDERGRYLAVNQAFVSGFGWPSAEAVVGKTDLDIAASNMAPKYRQDDLTVFTSSSCMPSEELIEMAGQHRWCETCKSPVTVDGEVVGMVGYARDITDRKMAEAAIAESRNLLRTVIDTVPVRVYWKDRNLSYLGCNAEFARDAGMAHPRNVIGKDDYQMRWAAQAEAYRAADLAVIESGFADLNKEESRTTPDGHVVWLRISRVPLRNADNQTIGLLGIYEDITESRRDAAELEQHRNHLDALVEERTAGLSPGGAAGKPPKPPFSPA